MKIGRFDLNTLGRPLFIAEAGAAHGGEADVAIEMTRVAIECGADAISFQEVDEERLYTPLPELPVPRQHRVGWDCLGRCRELAHQAGCAFSVCVTDDASLDAALRLGLDFLKVVSYDATFYPFLRRCGETGLPVLISSGACTFDEMEAALAALAAPTRTLVYHTDCGYPTPDGEVNLLRMLALQSRLKVPVGYCDHTADGLSCLAATALGATVLEKHFILDRQTKAADYMVSLEPAELAALIRDVQRVSTLRGDGRDVVQEGDRYRRERLRRSLAWKRDVAAGECITEDLLTMMRPPTGLAWHEQSLVVGRRAARPLRWREQVKPGDVV